jgi:hypothetical protein
MAQRSGYNINTQRRGAEDAEFAEKSGSEYESAVPEIRSDERFTVLPMLLTAELRS